MRELSWGPDADLWQLLAGVGLVVGGIVLAVDGLGVQQTPVGRVIDTYWAAPFLVLGLYGIVRGVRRGRPGLFASVAVTLAAAAFLVEGLHLAHINGWTLVWAVVLLTFGLGALADHQRRRHRSRWMGWSPRAEPQRPPETETGWHRPDRGTGDTRRFTQWMGDLRLDLGDFPLDGPLTRFEAEIGLGDLTLLVPGTWAVKVVATAGLGEVRAYGRHAAGVGPRVAYQSPGYESAEQRVEIWAHVGLGAVDVHPF